MLYYVHDHGAIAQLARASHWQCEGREFESLLLHHDFPSSSKSCFFCALKRHKNCSAGKIMPSIAQSATEGDCAKTSKRRKAQKLLCRENHALHSTKCDGGRPRKENRKDQQICFTPTLSAASTIQVNDISAVPVIYVSG